MERELLYRDYEDDFATSFGYSKEILESVSEWRNAVAEALELKQEDNFMYDYDDEREEDTRMEKEKTGETQISMKKLHIDAITPTRGSDQAAGYDLYARLDYPVEVAPHKTVKVGTGLSFALPNGTFGAVFARSGLATKQGLRPANAVGVCDSDYRGEYIVALHNDSDETRVVNPGDRIAQLVVMPYIPVAFNEVDELDETSRGAGGFGSTGV